MQEESEPVKHRGTVIGIEGDKLTLQLDDDCRTDCQGCAMASLCGDTRSSGRVTLPVKALPPGLHIGNRVLATASAQAQVLSATALMIIPMLVLVGIIVWLSSTGTPKWLVVAAAVAGAVIFDAPILWYLRKSRKIMWNITLL